LDKSAWILDISKSKLNHKLILKAKQAFKKVPSLFDFIFGISQLVFVQWNVFHDDSSHSRKCTYKVEDHGVNFRNNAAVVPLISDYEQVLNLVEVTIHAYVLRS
jgi:hypothetical protein